MSAARIVLSLVGILLGIFLSFVVIGIDAQSTARTIQESKKDTVAVSGAKNSADSTHAIAKSDSPADRFKIMTFTWAYFVKIAIISFVLCMLTYPMLYQSLRLYVNEPAFLTLFVAFQYGFLWQSVIHTVA
ncbi:MAG TPA: hypothetical protein VHE34_16770 [Puia sp.]|uniref:hypothetical protein n=1 Tax=Puia sp. TaxID=2045100 RepID=UPI002C7078AC|nr:hypothetical protein [Puia sp.]HVU96886.1 hypothetical protein [Puia sp.]